MFGRFFLFLLMLSDVFEKVRFLRAHPEVYAQSGFALLVMAMTLTATTLAIADALAARVGGLALRWASAFGFFAAAFFLMHGVVRLSAGPLLYIDGMDPDWGEAAYLVVQMVGIHASISSRSWMRVLLRGGPRRRRLPVAPIANTTSERRSLEEGLHDGRTRRRSDVRPARLAIEEKQG